MSWIQIHVYVTSMSYRHALNPLSFDLLYAFQIFGEQKRSWEAELENFHDWAHFYGKEVSMLQPAIKKLAFYRKCLKENVRCL